MRLRQLTGYPLQQTLVLSKQRMKSEHEETLQWIRNLISSSATEE